QRLRDAQRSFYETQGPVVPEVKTPKEAPPKAEAKAKMAFAAEVVESLPKKDTPELPESWRKKPATQDVLESARRKAKSAALPGALDEPEVHETPPSTRRRSASSRKSSLLSQKKGFGGYGGVADTEEVSPKEKQRQLAGKHSAEFILRFNS
ncbi:unnamed protein product, partial [Effrenium voratum]